MSKKSCDFYSGGIKEKPLETVFGQEKLVFSGLFGCWGRFNKVLIFYLSQKKEFGINYI